MKLDKEEVFEYLMKLYIETRNRAETIKSGIEKYNMSEQQINEIMELVQNEIRIKSEKETQMLSKKNTEKNHNIVKKQEFKTSLFQFYIHKQIYRIILHCIISITLIVIIRKYMINGFWGMLSIIYMFVGLVYLLFGLGYVKGKFVIDGASCYFSSFISSYDEENPSRNYTTYTQYIFKNINNIIETPNKIIILGDITYNREIEGYGAESTSKNMKRVAFIKCFKENSRLIKELENLINIKK